MNNIEILEEKIKIIESLCTDDCINKSTVIQPLKYAIENLIKENKELKDTNKKLYELCQGKAMQEFINNECDYIPKSKVKEKIEEIDIEIQCCEYADDDTEEYKQDIEKEKRRLLRDKAVLQSLLEKE